MEKQKNRLLRGPQSRLRHSTRRKSFDPKELVNTFSISFLNELDSILSNESKYKNIERRLNNSPLVFKSRGDNKQIILVSRFELSSLRQAIDSVVKETAYIQ